MKAFVRLFNGFLVCAALSAGQVAAHPIGGGAASGLFTNMSPFCNEEDLLALLTCVIDPPMGISADPGAGHWLKQLPGVGFPDEISLTEKLVVGQPGLPGHNWTDWHEVIVTPNWGWRSGVFTVVGGGVFVGEISIDGKEIDFDGFDLAPGTEVEIVKQLFCQDLNADECRGLADILVQEWPTTAAAPAPATLALLVLGLAGLGCARRAATKR